MLFGRPPFMGIGGGKQRLPSTDVCENDMLNYCKEMSCLLSNISVQVKVPRGRLLRDSCTKSDLAISW